MPKMSRLNPDTILEWRRRYEAGESTKQIAAFFGVGGGTVYDRLKIMGTANRYRIASTAGNVSADTIRRYIEAQKGI